MNVYFDTSALIKLIVDEHQSAVAATLWDRAGRALTSLLAYPEARAALAAAGRGGRLSASEARRAVALLDELWEELGIIGLDERLVRIAGVLSERHALRGYDAVHLATALSVETAENLVIATWDRALANAASAEGRPVAPADGDP